MIDFHDCSHTNTEVQEWGKYRDPEESEAVLVCLDCGAWYNDMEQEWQFRAGEI